MQNQRLAEFQKNDSSPEADKIVSTKIPGRRKKASGAQGRKRRKAQYEECVKSSKILAAFLKREDPDPSASKSVQDVTRDAADYSAERLEQEHLEEMCSSGTDSRQPDVGKMECEGLSCSEENPEADLPDPVPQDKAKYVNVVPDVIRHRDFGYLKFDQTSEKILVSDALRMEIVARGSCYFQNGAGPFARRNKRAMTSAWFTRRKGKRNTVSRSWLVYSPVKGVVFCFSCLLFPSQDTGSSSLQSENGFSNWKKPEYITSHENSRRRQISFTLWKDMEVRLKGKGGLIEAQLQNVIARGTNRQPFGERSTIIGEQRKALCTSASSSLKIKLEKTDEAIMEDGPGNSEKTFRFSDKPTLEDIRSLQAAFAAERGWGKYHQPRNLLLALVGEVGEVAELFQWRAEAPEGLPGWTESDREALSDELSDVLIYLVALADKCHVDLPSAALRKIEKNRLKYPAEKVYGSSKKYTEYQK